MAKASEPSQRSAGAQGVLDAAKALFSEQGYDAVSIHAIAERAGVSKANVFHHFESKEALYLAVLEQACARFSELLECQQEEGGDVGEVVRAFAQRHMRLLEADEQRAHLILRGILTNGERLSAGRSEAVFAEGFLRLVRLFSDAGECGVLRAGISPALPAFLLLTGNVLYFKLRDRITDSAALAPDAEHFVSMLCDLVLHGALRPAVESAAG
ncbi:MAG: TetR/AcrR family transcriptional regulator [Pseudomonadota bacterium]|nr:TetR/AcrR family transcriptional regulator [Pseudomonadota bacterium]HJO35971.1 TetR/AcrR family transcriptional regulator [Gammaproteobacteria bacterium]